MLGINGASVILYDDVLKAFCEDHRCDRVYILPSSIHELFLIPEDALFYWNRQAENGCGCCKAKGYRSEGTDSLG